MSTASPTQQENTPPSPGTGTPLAEQHRWLPRVAFFILPLYGILIHWWILFLTVFTIGDSPQVGFLSETLGTLAFITAFLALAAWLVCAAFYAFRRNQRRPAWSWIPIAAFEIHFFLLAATWIFVLTD